MTETCRSCRLKRQSGEKLIAVYLRFVCVKGRAEKSCLLALCWVTLAVILPQKEDVGLSVLLVARGVHDEVEAEK